MVSASPAAEAAATHHERVCANTAILGMPCITTDPSTLTGIMRMPDAAAEVNVRSAAAQSAAVPTCRNCGANASGHYCANCGQETALALPTFRSFMREAAGRYVALDGRLWRSLFGLVARPGFLTREYFAGRRRRYIRPARLFLVLYLLLFAVIGLVQSPADLGDEIVFVQSDGAPAANPSVPGTPDAAPGGRATPPAEQRAAVPQSAAGAEGAIDVKGSVGDPAGANDVVGAGGDTLLGFDKDLNLTLRMRGAEQTLPAPLRKRYEQFKRLSKEQKAERLYAGAVALRPLWDGGAAARVRAAAQAGLPRTWPALSQPSATVCRAPRLQRASAFVRRPGVDRDRRVALARPAAAAGTVDRVLRVARAARRVSADAGGRDCCARPSWPPATRS